MQTCGYSCAARCVFGDAWSEVSAVVREAKKTPEARRAWMKTLKDFFSMHGFLGPAVAQHMLLPWQDAVGEKLLEKKYRRKKKDDSPTSTTSPSPNTGLRLGLIYFLCRYCTCRAFNSKDFCCCARRVTCATTHRPESR